MKLREGGRYGEKIENTENNRGRGREGGREGGKRCVISRELCRQHQNKRTNEEIKMCLKRRR